MKDLLERGTIDFASRVNSLANGRREKREREEGNSRIAKETMVNQPASLVLPPVALAAAPLSPAVPEGGALHVTPSTLCHQIRIRSPQSVILLLTEIGEKRYYPFRRSLAPAANDVSEKNKRACRARKNRGVRRRNGRGAADLHPRCSLA